MNLTQYTLLFGWMVLVGFLGADATNINMTTSLGMVSGTVLEGSPEVYAFHSIPFAKPPVGNLRFKPPQPAESWSDVRDATKLSNSCWQLEDEAFGRFSGVDMWNPNTNMSEDCLYLNAWIPASDAVKPIVVWIYGGGFWAGTSTLDVYNAHQLAATQDVIVVSFNYRLGPLGFLYTGTDNSPGNVGLLDQVIALKWIKDNAKNMGGDPERITLIGESAGATSIGFHLLSPLSQDFFNNVIMMSASPMVFWGVQSDAEERAEKLAELVGCTDNNTEDEMVECLRKVDPADLVSQQWSLIQNYFEVPIGPVVDGHFLPRHPEDLMADGMVKNTSIMTGVVKDEGTFWVLYGFMNVYFKFQDPPRPINATEYDDVVTSLLKAFGDKFASEDDLNNIKKFAMMKYYDTVQPWERTSHVDAIDDMSGDTLFKCAVVDFAQYYSSHIGRDVYLYSFEHRVTTNTWPEWLGVAHGYEIEVFLGIPVLQPHNYTAGERQLSLEVMSMISNFAQTGDPNSGSQSLPVEWPRYTPEQQEYLIIDENNTHVDQGLRYETCTFWEKEVPLLQENEGTFCTDEGSGQ